MSNSELYKKGREIFKGIVAISITPMKEDQSVDEQGFRSHLNFIFENALKGNEGCLVITGSTGECGALSIGERKKIMEIAVDEIGDKVPVIVGCNHSNIYDVIDLAKYAEKVGAKGVMILAPYYYRPTDDVIIDFYKEVSSKIGLGIMIYNNIEVTRYDIPIPVLEELAEIANIVAIKECTPNFVKLVREVDILGDRLQIINGHGEFLEPFAGLSGSPGFISSTANFAPKVVRALWEAIKNKDFGKALEIRKTLNAYLYFAMDLGSKGGEPKVLALIKKLTDLVGSKGGPGRIPILELDSKELEIARDIASKIKSSPW